MIGVPEASATLLSAFLEAALIPATIADPKPDKQISQVLDQPGPRTTPLATVRQRLLQLTGSPLETPGPADDSKPGNHLVMYSRPRECDPRPGRSGIKYACNLDKINDRSVP